jgi:DNA polymerase
MIKENMMKKINELIKSCNKCELYKTKTNYVIGNGSYNSKIIFIGEAPGYNEDRIGIPFVGKAGKIFDDLLLFIGLNRNEIYITNILKCRPPKNRNPSNKEIKLCTKYLNSELEIIKPVIISTLGNFSTNFIFKKYGLDFGMISNIHGKVYHIKNFIEELYIIPQYHPAVVVYNANKIGILKKDFKILKNLLIKLNIDI